MSGRAGHRPRGRRRLPVAAALAVLFGSTASAMADTMPDCDIPPVPFDSIAYAVPSNLFDDLAGWIARNTMYDVTDLYTDPPEIRFCAPSDRIPYEAGDLHVDAALDAVYDVTRRTIHLVRPWSELNLYDQSLLLHEFIHVVQLDNRDWPCIGAPEWEAYRLQDLWLHEHGIFHPFNWPLIRILATCPEPPEN